MVSPPLFTLTQNIHENTNENPKTNTHPTQKTTTSTTNTKSGKHRMFTIEDDVDSDNMDPNLEEPLKAAKLKRMPSRQGAHEIHLIFVQSV